MLSQIKNLVDHNKERLAWDDYFMSIALIASQRSPCKRLNVGSVIVKDCRLISMGYNGYIFGAPHVSRVKDNHEQSIIHSEINAIADCAKRGTSLSNGIIYITHYPCLHCFRAIAASNIKEIVYLNNYNNDDMVAILAHDSSIIIRQIIHIDSLLVSI
jgi:dCMP deaminase